MTDPATLANCVTHHHACDCREAEQRQIITDLLGALTDHVWSGDGPDDECQTCQAILRAEAWIGPRP
jgi:hypothetical protein